VWGVLAGGATFDQVTINQRHHAINPELILTYKLFNAKLTSFQTMSSGTGAPDDVITLSFSAIEEDYFRQNPDGSQGNPVVVSYNLAGQVPVTIISKPFTVLNPVPTITAISPGSVQEGSGAVLVTLTGSNFVNGATAQLNGTDLTATVVGSGQVQVTVPASFFTEEAGFTVTVTNPLSAGPSNGLTLAVFDAPLAASAARVNAAEGAALSNVLVATFTDQDPGGTASDYSAVIDWGDGDTTVAGSVSIRPDPQVAGQFDVYASKTSPYAEEGGRQITVTITDNPASATAQSTVVIADAPLKPINVTVSPVAGAPFTGVVASFTDADPAGTAGDYSALINWGDGNSSTGVIAANSSGGFDVTGSNTFAAAGPYAVTVSIADSGSSTATANSTANVSNLGSGVQKGQSAGIGFWHNKQGQALLNSFNGGPSSSALANWLATTLPNLYGANAGAHNLTGLTNSQVAAFYESLFSTKGSKLEAQVLDTALDVYATTLSLGGMSAAAYGFQVTAYGLGASSYNVGGAGSAFGVANNTLLNVYQILLAANQQAKNGVLYNGDKTLSAEALVVFSGIDSSGGI
jgi:hypothetical protein